MSSNVGFKGIAKKVVIFVLVGIARIIDQQFLGQTALLRDAVILFYCANEGLSILENADIMGVPFPQKLREMFLHLKEKDKDEKIKMNREPKKKPPLGGQTKDEQSAEGQGRTTATEATDNGGSATRIEKLSGGSEATRDTSGTIVRDGSRNALRPRTKKRSGDGTKEGPTPLRGRSPTTESRTDGRNESTTNDRRNGHHWLGTGAKTRRQSGGEEKSATARNRTQRPRSAQSTEKTGRTE